MYNSINPINITYRNPRQAYGSPNSDTQEQNVNPDAHSPQDNRFPNGTKVAIDYTKNSINISQIVTDFKSTVVAIGAPDEVSDEVYSYLSLVEKESLKQNPSRDIILSNLKNASKISDKYINAELSKRNGKTPSNVVEGWIDALFLQKIDLKADPDKVNPYFKLDIPEKKTANLSHAPQKPQTPQESEPSLESAHSEVLQKPTQLNVFEGSVDEVEPQEVYQAQVEQDVSIPYIEADSDEIQTVSTIEQPINTVSLQTKKDLQTIEDDFQAPLQLAAPRQEEPSVIEQVQKPQKPKYITSSHDRILSKSLKEAKTLLELQDDPAAALELINDTLGEVTPDTNPNLRAALHFERGKIFDDYDYVNYALRDYYEATKCDDDNLVSKAHLNMARIYDDYVEFEPAVEHYQDAVAYSGEANNSVAQTKILGEMASMFAHRFDVDSSDMLNLLSIESAQSSGDSRLISWAYSNAAKNYEYTGNNFDALDCYKNAVLAISTTPEDADLFEMRAKNYEDAANVMDKMGNVAKAENLLSKARLYRQRAKLEQMALAG